MSKSHILIIEDEIKIARFLQLELEYEGYKVTHCLDGREGLEFYRHYGADLILLDIMMPRLNGIEVCRRIREASDVPIIIVTAKDDTLDKVMGLDTGANDYVTKPFVIEELLARIRANLKKGSVAHRNGQRLKAGELLLDIDKFSASYRAEAVELTKKEFDLMAFLLANKNSVVSRQQILENVWGYNFVGDTNVVDVYIRYLRAKIDDVYQVKIIHTVRGVGYTVKDNEDA